MSVCMSLIHRTRVDLPPVLLPVPSPVTVSISVFQFRPNLRSWRRRREDSHESLPLERSDLTVRTSERP